MFAWSVKQKLLFFLFVFEFAKLLKKCDARRATNCTRPRRIRGHAMALNESCCFWNLFFSKYVFVCAFRLLDAAPQAPRRRASRYLSAMLWKYSFLVSQQRAASNRLGTVSSRSTFHNLCSMTNFLPKALLNQTCGHWPYIVCENIFTVSDRREHQNGLLPQQMLVLNKFV